MTTTAPGAVQGSDEVQDAGHVDVLIVGAGVSGIGAAHHLRERFPDRSFVLLDAQDDRGGTWWTHRYPGVRSDSDLFTYGYRYKPWRGPVDRGRRRDPRLPRRGDRGGRPRPAHPLPPPGDRRAAGPPRTGAGPSRSPGATPASELRCTTDFLWMCQGYYDHAKPYRPQWEGMDRFAGRIVHPQQWPDGPRPRRQARRRHRLGLDGRDADPRDRAGGRARDDAAALARPTSSPRR